MDFHFDLNFVVNHFVANFVDDKKMVLVMSPNLSLSGLYAVMGSSVLDYVFDVVVVMLGHGNAVAVACDLDVNKKNKSRGLKKN